MAGSSIDVDYAYIRLGLAAGSPLHEIEAVLVNARAYRFSTRMRVEQVQKFASFIDARSLLGALSLSFAEARKAYHKKAMALHPDRNRGDLNSENELKAINAAYARVETIHREARDYFKLDEDQRLSIEREAREATERETPATPKTEQTPPQNRTKTAEPSRKTATAAGTIKYMASSIPRYIRTARLNYLRLGTIIGCWHIEVENDINKVFDVIMLPEKEFMRARMYLGVPSIVNPALERGRFAPPYIPKDVKEVIVQADDPNHETLAKQHFLQEFGLLNPKR